MHDISEWCDRANVDVRDDDFTCVIWLMHMPETISKRMSNKHTSLSRVSSKKAHVNTAASSANECRNRKFELNLCMCHELIHMNQAHHDTATSSANECRKGMFERNLCLYHELLYCVWARALRDTHIWAAQTSAAIESSNWICVCHKLIHMNLCVSHTHTHESGTSWHRYQQRERVPEQNIPTQSVFESRTHAYESGSCWYATLLLSVCLVHSQREVGGWGRDPFSRNFMKPTPRRK